jgi:hypothetical protein
MGDDDWNMQKIVDTAKIIRKLTGKYRVVTPSRYALP